MTGFRPRIFAENFKGHMHNLINSFLQYSLFSREGHSSEIVWNWLVSLWSNSLPQSWKEPITILNLCSPVPWITTYDSTHILKLKLAYLDRIGPAWKGLPRCSNQTDPKIPPLFDTKSEFRRFVLKWQKPPYWRQHLQTVYERDSKLEMFDLVCHANGSRNLNLYSLLPPFDSLFLCIFSVQ